MGARAVVGAGAKLTRVIIAAAKIPFRDVGYYRFTRIRSNL